MSEVLDHPPVDVPTDEVLRALHDRERELIVRRRVEAAAPDLLDALKAIKLYGELVNISAGHGWGSSGGKKPASKDMFAFPRHMLVEVDEAIAKAEGLPLPPRQ